MASVLLLSASVASRTVVPVVQLTLRSAAAMGTIMWPSHV